MEKRYRYRVLAVLVLLSGLMLLSADTAAAARIKDLAVIQGIRSNQLSGYGLVVGLNGTGDKSGVSFTKQALANMMEKMNIHVNKNQLAVKNVAAVMVTASIPAFARIGDRIDVSVSSLGDAKSLRGGTLLVTPLRGVDNQVYALAQGALSLGGGGDGQDSHQLVGRIANGATIEQEIAFKLNGKRHLVLSLNRPDFTTARRMAETINASLGKATARIVDSSAIHLSVPDHMYEQNVAEFIADVETLDVVPDTRAKVVINEKTGTVVIGSDVTISTVAVAHKDLAVTIAAEGGAEDENQVMQLPGNSTIGELVNGLNAIGVTPNDLISILQSIKAAGALQAELELI